MLWFEEIASKVEGPELINDSKTPSGRVHVGALRGVLIHDAVFKALQAVGKPCRYSFGVDNYDPLDELPAEAPEMYEPYLGQPLCKVPAPPGSPAANIGEHYMSEFLDVFAHLGVEVELYRTAEIYESGNFNHEIDVILSHAADVRDIYRRVSGSERPGDWHPFQVICESCGRIGTTKVTAYDGQEVTYECLPKLVTWAQGCGHRGKISPFDGRGKLPWKLEWAAKWHHFGITIEGAGKDHCTKGGANDVASAVLRRLFRKEPPLNIPYEFFLVGGAKMSSSRGVGVSAREMADFLPPEVLRFLVLSRRPNQQVNFSPDKQTVFHLFDRFDKTRAQAQDGDVDARTLLTFCGADLEAASYLDFQLLVTLMQLPKIDVAEEAKKRKEAPLDQHEERELVSRIAAARFWLETYATEEDRIEVQETLPEDAHELDNVQRGFLHRLAADLEEVEWKDEPLQVTVYDAARFTPINQKHAFAALYRVLLGRESGPRAGGLLSVLDRKLVRQRLVELPYEDFDLWLESAVDEETLAAWVGKNRKKISEVTVTPRFRIAEEHDSASRIAGFFDLLVRFANGREEVKRLLRFDESVDVDELDERRQAFLGSAADDVAALSRAHGLEMRLSKAA